jgi:hypothetical protein
MLVLGGGVEGSQTVQLDGLTLGQQLGDTLAELSQNTIDYVDGVDGTMVRDVLGQATQGEGTVTLKFSIQTSELVRLLIVVGAKIHAKFDRIYSSHNN